MSGINIEDLFETARLPSGLLLLPLVLYAPLGFTLAAIRCFVGLQAFLASCILPKTTTIRGYVLRTMCFVLGIVVQEGDKKHKHRAPKVVVTNHITMLDHLAVDLVLPSTTPSVWDLPRPLSWALGFKDLGVQEGRDTLIRNVKRYCQDSEIPVLAHPEGATTNGKKGLLKFSTWPFSLEYPVSPIVLEVKRLPFLNVPPSVLGSRWWSDIMWFLFSPCTVFKIRYLSEMRREEGESEEGFTCRVQESMAHALGITATPFTCADKIEYLKRVLFSPSVRPQGLQSSTEVEPWLKQMINQVKEVLPYVPADVIKQDLVTTRSISLTISNILEGVVPYTPETDSDVESDKQKETVGNANSSSQSMESGDSHVSPVPQFYDGFCTAAHSFGRSANERMHSYLERKERLLAIAKRRYIDKHRLTLS